MSASASGTQSATDSHNIQASTQGASGALSPTITAGGSVKFQSVQNDPTLQLETVKTIGDVVTSALKQVAATTGGAYDAVTAAGSNVAATAQSSQQNNQALLEQALAAQSQLAQIQATGGASLTSGSTNYLIWGAIAIVALAFFMLTGRKH